MKEGEGCMLQITEYELNLIKFRSFKEYFWSGNCY